MNTIDSIQFFDFRKSGRTFSSSSRFVNIQHRQRTDTSCAKYVLSFPSSIGNEVYEAGCNCIRLANNSITGEWFLVFTKDVGVACAFKKSHNDNMHPIEVFCKDMVLFMTENLRIKIENGSAHVNLSQNLSSQKGTMTYKLCL